MDRKLITGAIALLVVQTFLLLADFGKLPGIAWLPSENPHQPTIGVVLEKNQNLKRRGQGSVVWEDSQTSDNLSAHDSVLTLENSSARLKLQGDIQIDLHENTLIVLEPSEKPDDPSALSIRFSEGQMLSRNQNQKFRVGTSQFVMEATAGSNLSLKSLDKDVVEVEVTTGSVSLTSKDQKVPAKTITQGSRFTLASNEVSSVQKISAELKFVHRPEERVYTHTPPIDWNLRWTGLAEKLRYIAPDKKISELSVAAKKKSGEMSEQSHEVSLGLGTHSFTLIGKDETSGENKISSEQRVRVLSAPPIRYTTPLPRDRFTLGDKVLVSWLPLEGAASYIVELTTRAEMRGPASVSTSTTESQVLRQTFPTKDTSLMVTPAVDGEVSMRVFGIDADGFKIPPHYALPFYILQDPLAPPKLRTPSSAPAESDSSDTSAWYKIWSQFFPTAQAAEPDQAHIVLSWYPVNGADFYNLEISSNADFSKPEVLTKVKGEKYRWANFRKDIYYWRVAAGANSGRMGLFSETAKIDLSKIDILASGELAPGVRLVRPAASEVSLVTVPTASTPPVPVGTPAPLATKPVEEPAKPLETTEPVPTTTSHWKLSAQVDLQHVSFSQEKVFSASLNGFADYAVHVNAARTRDDVTWSGHFFMEKINWEVDDAASWPYQEDGTSEHYRIDIKRKDVDKDLYFGLSNYTMTTLEREDLEELTFVEKNMTGPGIGYDIVVTKDILFSAYGGIAFGDKLMSLFAQNELNYKIYAAKKFNLILGGNFNFQIFFGSDSLSGYDLKSGIHLRTDF